MKCLHLFRMLNMTSRISCNRAIQTGSVVLARTRIRNVPRKINYEPGLKHTEAALSENSDLLEEFENEEDLENIADVMSFDKTHDMDNLDEKKRRSRIGYIITAKKFFKSPQEPTTLSCNERECIRYLHKTDPVQWDVKTLSESFPATPDAIRKILKGKFKFSEERKKKIDLRVQKNWELLAEGKLQAAPEVLAHLKKFINRKEVLLDQIKKVNFYLPEVKEEIIWNNGEMSNILIHYEKTLQKLSHKQETQDHNGFRDGYQESDRKIKKQGKICADTEKPEKLILNDEKKENDLPDNKTISVFSNECKKVPCEVPIEAEAEISSSPNKKSDLEGIKKRTDFSDPERFRRENQYYANQIKDIENTAFWNKGRTSQEKASAENEKAPLGGPDDIARGKVCSSDVYPERIKIPQDKKGSGLTFRVKDCYYDDDGEFLYRVPGMVN